MLELKRNDFVFGYGLLFTIIAFHRTSVDGIKNNLIIVIIASPTHPLPTLILFLPSFSNF